MNGSTESQDEKQYKQPAACTTLASFLRFLLLAEIDPCRDYGVVETMSAFYDRYKWAFGGQRTPALQDETLFLRKELKQRGIKGSPDDIEFINVFNWKKLSDTGYGEIGDTNPFVPYVDFTIADVTIRINLRNALIQPDLITSDREKVYVAAVRSGKQAYDGMMVISPEVYDAFGDEDDDIRYCLASEYFRSTETIQDLLHFSEKRRMLAKTMAYFSTLSDSVDKISTEELIAAFQKANNGASMFEAQGAPDLLEAIGFISRNGDSSYTLAEAFCVSRHLLSVFGCCIGASFWALDQKMELLETITKHFSISDSQRHISLMVCPDIGRRLLTPVLLMAESKQELQPEDRAALFEFMMSTLTETEEELRFSMRIADALLSDNLLPDEANFFIESDPDDLPQVMDYMKARFRASTKRPAFYYVCALQTICEDEPAFAISLAEDLAQTNNLDLEVLGYAVLGTLAKAALEQWNLCGVAGDTISHQRTIDKLLALAATNDSAQMFYQKMLSNLVVAGYIRINSASFLTNPSLPKQYRDPWLAEGANEAVGFYPREFYVLDNFSAFAIQFDGEVYPTAEHAYQAQKIDHSHPEIAELIRTAPSPHEAKMLAEKSRDFWRADWDRLKLRIMEDILRAKLQQHSYCRKKLLETGEMPIVEDSPYDSFWGIGLDRRGENRLGKLWMLLRSELSGI